MKQSEFNLDEAVAILGRTPATLSALLDGLPEPWTQAIEGEGTWSAYYVVGHLIHGERTDWIPRARHILADDPRPLVPFDRPLQFTETQSQTLWQLFDTFATLRQDNVATLRGMYLPYLDLDRGAFT